MRGSLIIHDTDQFDAKISDFGFHVEMGKLIFFAYWNGNGNKYLAAKWAVQFIKDHQGIKDE